MYVYILYVHVYCIYMYTNLESSMDLSCGSDRSDRSDVDMVELYSTFIAFRGPFFFSSCIYRYIYRYV